VNERQAWRTILALSVVGAGAYVGNESPAREYSHYFWDLTGYVLALESEFPYRTTETFTFLYPPVARRRWRRCAGERALCRVTAFRLE
jgi:hypothetical protein